jgi:hypothetical protein
MRARVCDSIGSAGAVFAESAGAVFAEMRRSVRRERLAQCSPRCGAVFAESAGAVFAESAGAVFAEMRRSVRRAFSAFAEVLTTARGHLRAHPP